MRTTPAQKEAKRIRKIREKNVYLKATHRSYTIRFHKELDADIISRLDSQKSRAGYIKALIRRDMEEER